MNTGILIVAHAPLADALRQCVLHVFPEAGPWVVAFDVQPNTPPEEALAGATEALSRLNSNHVLVLVDVVGATPCNVAQKLVDGVHSKLIAGVNLPMLLRTVTYRSESLDSLVARAVVGGTQGVMQVTTTTPPQRQGRRFNDKSNHDHQQ